MILDCRKEILPVAALLVMCALLLGFRLGKTGLIDPDEPFYSLTAKEMLSRHDLSTPMMFGKPQFEKPILFYWVIYGFFNWLGVSEFSARLGPCLAGLSTVLITYFWSRVLFHRRSVAFVSALVLASSLQFVIMSRIVLTDIFLCLFVTATLFCFSLGEQNPKHRTLSWNLVFVFSALGFLTKGPLGLLIPFSGILCYAALANEHRIFREMPWLSGSILFVLIGLPWYGLMTWKYGISFLRQSFVHENLRRFFVAEHSGSDKAIFYPFVLFAGFFPWSTFLIPAFARAGRQVFGKRGVEYKKILFLSISFFVPFTFFMIAKSKLMSYIFPIYPMVAILTGSWMFRLYRAVRRGIRPEWSLLSIQALLWGVVPSALVAGTFWYAATNGVNVQTPLFFILFTMVPLLWVSFYFFYREKYMLAFSGTIVSMFFLSALGFGALLPQMEEVISSKKWSQKNGKSTEGRPSFHLFTSKIFIRGVSFYTGHPDIGVFSDKPDGDFYTPHPIRIVSDTRELSRIDAGQFPIYFLLRQKEWNYLKTLVDGRYTLTILEALPQRMWVRLDHV